MKSQGAVFRLVGEFIHDVRLGVRALLKAPAWMGTVVLTLGMGIGLTTAIFSIVYGVLLRELPYSEPDRLIAIWNSSATLPRFGISPANWRDWRQQAESIEDISLTRPIANFNLTGDGQAERLQGARTSWNIAAILGVRPLLGRMFTEEETARDARVAVLSYNLWQRRFGMDPAIIGRKIQLNGEPFEVVGVMPATYSYPTRDFELWTPLYIPPQTFQLGADNSYWSVARLKPGVTVDRAQSELLTITRRFAGQYTATKVFQDEVTVTAEPLLDSDVRDVKRSLHVLMAAAGCLLFVGCLNLALLFIGRGIARQQELAVRSALGANGGRLARQMISETLPLACAGAVAGLVLSKWMLGVLLGWLPATMPRVEAIGLHAPVVWFAVASSFAVALGASLWPARRASAAQFHFGFQQVSRGVTRSGRTQGILVVAQVAVTMVVLFAGALFARSAFALLKVDLGFVPDRVLTMHLAVTRAKYPRDAQIADYYRRLEERIEGLPGVVGAGFVNRLPLSGIAQVNPVEFEDRLDMGPISTDTRSATPGYFGAVGISLRAGRLFLETDREGTPPVALIDETLSRRVFGDTNPLGRRIRIGVGTIQGPWAEIVGVVGHIRNDSPQLDLRSQVYFPQAQRAQDRAALVIKTSSDSVSIASVIDQIHQENPEQPVYDARTLGEWRDRSVHSQRLLTFLVSLFGIAALLLASFGLYGVVSYATSMRMREFAIRVALGAERSDVRRLVLGHAGRLVAIGSAVGLALAYLVGRGVQSLLYEVKATDGVALTVAAVSLAVVCLIAASGPARRATTLDPARALRSE